MSQAPLGPIPATPPGWPAPGPPARRNPSRLLGVLTAVAALLALGFAVAAWFRAAPKPEAAPVYSDQQVADAKKAVCEAYSTTREMLLVNSDRKGSNPTEELVAGVNTRFAINAASNLLSRTLDKNPATPSSLATEVRQLASAFETVVIDQLEGADRSKLDADYAAADEHSKPVFEACV